MNSPLVTITLPTYNSTATLVICLKSIFNQTYRNIEVNVIDGGSKDNSIEIAKKFGVSNIKILKGSLLEARHEGVKLAKGKYILIFDSDQILQPDSIERALNLIEGKNLDMLAFGESVYKKDTFIEKLFNLDRRLINRINDLSPLTGVIMPRFFRTELLRKAYENIPKSMFPNTGGPDHAIVYYEARKISKKIGVLPKAVKHIEPRTLIQMWPKFYRWGYTSVDAHFGKYKRLMIQKERFRTGLFTKGLVKESMGSILLLILKGLSFKLGYYIGRLDKRLEIFRRY